MKTSEKIDELVAAMAAARGEFEPIEKLRTGKVSTEKATFSYDYADLSDVMAATSPALSKHGLVLSHDAEVIREPVLSVRVTARLEHSSGQWKESTPLEIPCDGRMGAAQLIGSADTYGRRYTTCSILGVVAESDDDGTIAAGQQAETTQRQPLPACPKCKTSKSVIVGKAEYGGGYVCFSKKGGCGTKWQADGADHEPAGEDAGNSQPQPSQQSGTSPAGSDGKGTPTQRFNAAVQLMAAASDAAKINEIIAGAKALQKAGVFTPLMVSGLVQTGYSKLSGLVDGDLACDELLATVTRDHQAGLLSYDQLCTLEDRINNKRAAATAA